MNDDTLHDVVYYALKDQLGTDAELREFAKDIPAASGVSVKFTSALAVRLAVQVVKRIKENAECRNE